MNSIIHLITVFPGIRGRRATIGASGTDFRGQESTDELPGSMSEILGGQGTYHIFTKVGSH